jgi:hypothetical protein
MTLGRPPVSPISAGFMLPADLLHAHGGHARARPARAAKNQHGEG